MRQLHFATPGPWCVKRKAELFAVAVHHTILTEAVDVDHACQSATPACALDEVDVTRTGMRIAEARTASPGPVCSKRATPWFRATAPGEGDAPLTAMCTAKPWQLAWHPKCGVSTTDYTMWMRRYHVVCAVTRAVCASALSTGPVLGMTGATISLTESLSWHLHVQFAPVL